MGEFADMAIDFMLSEDEYALNSDGYDEYGEPIYSPFQRFRRYSRRKIPSCKYCGKTHLYWRQRSEDRSWYLADWNPDTELYERHACKFKGFGR